MFSFFILFEWGRRKAVSRGQGWGARVLLLRVFYLLCNMYSPLLLERGKCIIDLIVLFCFVYFLKKEKRRERKNRWGEKDKSVKREREREVYIFMCKWNNGMERRKKLWRNAPENLRGDCWEIKLDQLLAASQMLLQRDNPQVKLMIRRTRVSVQFERTIQRWAGERESATTTGDGFRLKVEQIASQYSRVGEKESRDGLDWGSWIRLNNVCDNKSELAGQTSSSLFVCSKGNTSSSQEGPTSERETKTLRLALSGGGRKQQLCGPRGFRGKRHVKEDASGVGVFAAKQYSIWETSRTRKPDPECACRRVATRLSRRTEQEHTRTTFKYIFIAQPHYIDLHQQHQHLTYSSSKCLKGTLFKTKKLSILFLLNSSFYLASFQNANIYPQDRQKDRHISPTLAIMLLSSGFFFSYGAQSARATSLGQVSTAELTANLSMYAHVRIHRYIQSLALAACIHTIIFSRKQKKKTMITHYHPCVWLRFRTTSPELPLVCANSFATIIALNIINIVIVLVVPLIHSICSCWEAHDAQVYHPPTRPSIQTDPAGIVRLGRNLGVKSTGRTQNSKKKKHLRIVLWVICLSAARDGCRLASYADLDDLHHRATDQITAHQRREHSYPAFRSDPQRVSNYSPGNKCHLTSHLITSPHKHQPAAASQSCVILFICVNCRHGGNISVSACLCSACVTGHVSPLRGSPKCLS
ncbi:hypothetical protein VP01_737g1 [Puccinia sorghi]|uniref:Uncharacterized protein n=1 Tax=Puccinia sorghi TaxID=27349 RepID=A0A0L6UCP5_9BASI|nr:hypothetical protein VP01_737g1 [Puccinia sorghi]